MPSTKLFIINVSHENERKKCLVREPISTIKLENTLDINAINYKSNL